MNFEINALFIQFPSDIYAYSLFRTNYINATTESGKNDISIMNDIGKTDK